MVDMYNVKCISYYLCHIIMYHSLEARMELNKEWRLLGQSEHPLLDHGAVDVVILDDDVLLEDLDCVQLVGPLPFSQHNLDKIIILYFIETLSSIV